MCRAPDHSVVVTGDDYGRVNLYEWPAHLPGASFTSSLGHAAKVTNVEFCPLDRSEILLSVGGDDKCIFQWKLSKDQSESDDK